MAAQEYHNLRRGRGRGGGGEGEGKRRKAGWTDENGWGWTWADREWAWKSRNGQVGAEIFMDGRGTAGLEMDGGGMIGVDDVRQRMIGEGSGSGRGGRRAAEKFPGVVVLSPRRTASPHSWLRMKSDLITAAATS